MKPMHSALPVATWMMRISVSVYLFLNYFHTVKVVNFERFDDVLVFVYLLVGVLLVVGGFISKPALTIISGALLFLISGYFMVVNFPATIVLSKVTVLMIYFWPLSIGLFFTAHGND